jgi:hypothetical protein
MQQTIDINGSVIKNDNNKTIDSSLMIGYIIEKEIIMKKNYMVAFNNNGDFDFNDTIFVGPFESKALAKKEISKAIASGDFVLKGTMPCSYEYATPEDFIIIELNKSFIS